MRQSLILIVVTIVILGGIILIPSGFVELPYPRGLLSLNHWHLYTYAAPISANHGSLHIRVDDRYINKHELFTTDDLSSAQNGGQRLVQHAIETSDVHPFLLQRLQALGVDTASAESITIERCVWQFDFDTPMTPPQIVRCETQATIQ